MWIKKIIKYLLVVFIIAILVSVNNSYKHTYTSLKYLKQSTNSLIDSRDCFDFSKAQSFNLTATRYWGTWSYK